MTMTATITYEPGSLLGAAGWWIWFLDTSGEVRCNVGVFESEAEAATELQALLDAHGSAEAVVEHIAQSGLEELARHARELGIDSDEEPGGDSERGGD